MEQADPDTVEFLSLDSNTKYCLVDTMVLLPLYRGDVDVIFDTRMGLNGAPLVLLRHIVGEAAYKYGEQEGESIRYGDFAASLEGRLKSARIPFRFVRFGEEMAAFWRGAIKGRKHPNLSDADYALLCAAVKRPRMDVMTDDKGLVGSIRRDRGRVPRGKIRSATLSYRKRRWATARHIERKILKHLPGNAAITWKDSGPRTEFLLGDSVVASMNHSGGDIRVDLSSCIADSDGRGPLQSTLARDIEKFFRKWKPYPNARHKKGWYRRQRSDDAVLAPR